MFKIAASEDIGRDRRHSSITSSCEMDHVHNFLNAHTVCNPEVKKSIGVKAGLL